MSYKFPALCFLIFLCAFAAVGQTVDEAASYAQLRSAQDVEIVFAVDLPASEQSKTISIRLLDEKDNVIGSGAISGPLASGRSLNAISIRLAEPLDDEIDGEILRSRVEYTIAGVTRLMSMSQILRDQFELTIIGREYIFSGNAYQVRVRAVNSADLKPIAGVSVDFALEISNDKSDKTVEIVRSAVTDANGSADVSIPLGRYDKDSAAELTVTGHRGYLSRTEFDDVNMQNIATDILLMSDRTLYQPGQTAHIRGIILEGNESRVVVNDAQLEYRILDEDSVVLYRKTVTSSAFGITNIDWNIPANAKLGTYSISVFHNGDRIGGRNFKVSRYDLPNFVVSADTDKKFYLPGDTTAVVEVSANYLFGKPVNGGKVRVVQENSREWNWKEQKYDIEEGQSREGMTAADGKFTTTVDLKADLDDLLDKDKWSDERSNDLHFTAYYTDLTTNRTEQRQFDIRISRQPIHVFYSEGNFASQNPALPVRAFVTAFYADGSPAVCDVEIKASIEDKNRFITVAKAKTNTDGLSEIEFDRRKIDNTDDDLDIRLYAKDANGLKGNAESSLRFDNDDAAEIRTDKSIYKPGEDITATIRTNVKDATAYIDVIQDLKTENSYFVRIENGVGTIKIPYTQQFAGSVNIAAAVLADDGDLDVMSAYTSVIFPAGDGIKINASFDKDVYKPDEAANLSFNIANAAGKAIESALGIVIVDQAYEERARTEGVDQAFFGDFAGVLGYYPGFGTTTIRDLNSLDLTKPIDADTQLLARRILRNGYFPFKSFRTYDKARLLKFAYAEKIKAKFGPARSAMQSEFRSSGGEYPKNADELNDALKRQGIDMTTARDPWGMPFNTKFSREKDKDIILILSSGPDKRADTVDDIEVFRESFEYFTPIGNRINKAIKDNSETPLTTRKAILNAIGEKDLKDIYGRPYMFDLEMYGSGIVLTINSLGEDGKRSKYSWQGDDFQVWRTNIDVFGHLNAQINLITKDFEKPPANAIEFQQRLKAAGIDLSNIRDTYGNNIYVTAMDSSRYWDRISLENVKVYGEDTVTTRQVRTPVTQKIRVFSLISPGKDAKPYTYDDLRIGQFTLVLSEESREPEKKVVASKQTSGAGFERISIVGIVTDSVGAVIPDVKIAVSDGSGVTKLSATDREGHFAIAGLTSGSYDIEFSASGFKTTLITKVNVVSDSVTELNVVLDPGSVAQSVEVTAGGQEVVETASSMVSTVRIQELPLVSRDPASLLSLKPGITKADQTPRVREYFPETLLWRPEVITDADGRAVVNFKMADSITTWKMYSIASTKDGKFGFAEKQATAFRSFFVDLDPPRSLTAGDEIFLPAQVRNYTEKQQKVEVKMDAEKWFSPIGSSIQNVEVKSGGSANAVFGFKAAEPIEKGRQRVTAVGDSDSDAIQKDVTVRPDGREENVSDASLFKQSEKLAIDIPPDAVSGGRDVRLRIYPGVYSHIYEAIDGLLKRPYGCGEQTISSTYPNLMLLKARPDSPNAALARKNLQSGYERMLGFRSSDGGFSYWGGKDVSDVALTAYAIRFLTDASSVIAVDKSVIDNASAFLQKAQAADGSWPYPSAWGIEYRDKQTVLRTAYIARVLAAVDHDLPAVAKALDHLRNGAARYDDPYVIALTGLTALEVGGEKNIALAREFTTRLSQLMQSERNSSFWDLRSNTAFYGWGSAGRIETTALVIQFLQKLSDMTNGGDHFAVETLPKAMMFLLTSKDRYGVWYSTQTTINVLDALLAGDAIKASGERTLTVTVNGKAAQKVRLRAGQIEATDIDLTSMAANGHLEVAIDGGEGSPILAQLTGKYYSPWSRSGDVASPVTLGLNENCDRTQAKIMEDITCTVKVERVGFRGYGMLVAEIGTPPGADVSRESLDAALIADGSISRYEILPDRIVLYMWAKAGGTACKFKFRQRYAINAKAPAAIAYDYYNPDAHAEAAPIRFTVN